MSEGENLCKGFDPVEAGGICFNFTQLSSFMRQGNEFLRGRKTTPGRPTQSFHHLFLRNEKASGPSARISKGKWSLSMTSKLGSSEEKGDHTEGNPIRGIGGKGTEEGLVEEGGFVHKSTWW